MTTIDPNTVQVSYTLTLPQINLVLKGLGCLPVAEAGDFFYGFKQHAELTVRAAQESAEAPAPAPPVAEPDGFGDVR